MKIRYFIIAFCLSFAVSNSIAQRFHGGLIAGMNACQVAGDSYSGYNKLGFVGGGFVNFNLMNLLSIQMEMEYSQKGSRLNPSDNSSASYKLNLDYVEIPVMLKFSFLKIFKLELGLAADILVHSYEEVNGNKVTFPRPFASTNYSTLLGLSFKLSNKFAFSIRTIDSFTNLRQSTNSGDVKRYFSWGQWHDDISLSVHYQIK